MENNLFFGGKTMILDGDFRQVLHVVKGGSLGEQVTSSLSKSIFWNVVKIIRLQQNMRSYQNEEFSQFLLRLGDVVQQSYNGDFVQLPQSMIIPWKYEHPIHQLIDSIFSNMIDHVNDANYMVGRAIITPKNIDVDKINEVLIGLFPGQEKVYTSWDSVDDDQHNLYKAEFLNSLRPSGLPSHLLILKRGSHIMLLRNVAPELGLCNGTRLICRNLCTNFIDAEIMTGPFRGKEFGAIGKFIDDNAIWIEELKEKMTSWCETKEVETMPNCTKD
ncbi:UNVERIFIED_CONTAM: hypothetical protein Sradi_3582000 [Sesamum radiatum]|uniref:ATP-dependent DNA helicase n=1 Tax=Sesamum radiatum TaxID=300843 RepID=A0AAW2QGI8_SESRA